MFNVGGVYAHIAPTFDSGDLFLTPDRSRSNHTSNNNVLSVSNPEQTGRLRGAGSSSTSSSAATSSTASSSRPMLPPHVFKTTGMSSDSFLDMSSTF